MKRDLNRVIAGAMLAAFCLTGAGCSMLGATLAVPVGNTPSAAPGPEMTTGGAELANLESDEPQKWSRLLKEGREHLNLGHYAAAEQSLLAAFRVSTRFRKSDIRRRVSFGNLERLASGYLIAHNEPSAARVLRIIALETKEETEFSYPGLGDLHLKLAELQNLEGATVEAERSYLRALGLRIEKSGRNSPTLMGVYQRLSRTEITNKKFQRGVVHAEQGLSIAEAVLSPDAPDLIAARLQVASACSEAGQYIKSEAQYLTALETIRKVVPGTLTEAVACNGLAYLYLKTKRLDAALANVDIAMGIVDGIELGGSGRAMVLDTKARILAADGKSDSASRLFDEVMSLAEAARPLERRTLYESFESFLKDQNRMIEAREIRRQIDELSGLPPDSSGRQEAQASQEPESAVAVSTPGLTSDPAVEAAWDSETTEVGGASAD